MAATTTPPRRTSMVTTGSKFFFGYAAAALVAGIVYGTATELEGSIELTGQVPFVDLPDGIVNGLIGPLTLGYKGGVGDHLGYGTLMGAGVIFLLLGVMTSAFRDADAEAVAELDGGVLGQLKRPSLISMWPPLAAFGAGSIVIGLAVSPLLVALGFVVLGLVLLEWTASAWAESASGDPEVNRVARNRLLFPLEIPIVGAVVLGAIVLLVSRILLAVSKLGSVYVAIGVAALILLVAVLIATRETISRNAVIIAVVVGAALLLIAGIVSAAIGTRDIEEHSEEHSEEAAPALVGDAP